MVNEMVNSIVAA